MWPETWKMTWAWQLLTMFYLHLHMITFLVCNKPWRQEAQEEHLYHLTYVLLKRQPISILLAIMKVTTTFLLLYIIRAGQGQGSCGPGCCQQKVVNNTRYILSHESKDLPSNCHDGCVYRMENGPKENLYCFMKGEGGHPLQECLNCKALPGDY